MSSLPSVDILPDPLYLDPVSGRVAIVSPVELPLAGHLRGEGEPHTGSYAYPFSRYATAAQAVERLRGQGVIQ